MSAIPSLTRQASAPLLVLVGSTATASREGLTIKASMLVMQTASQSPELNMFRHES